MANLLTVLFVGLKLTGYIDWAWWWVASPFVIELCVKAILHDFLLKIQAYDEIKKQKFMQELRNKKG